ncbi:uncharacterized protein LOC125216591 [Salvia hispanica]|uniref:uncharacterized protein LOC125216591 n=1 Tax=Salvia hispanica TaxID=49212 RepID=UPI0020092389|nr:uncharacterized protein LOC125216591 [Salvia hispanica]
MEEDVVRRSKNLTRAIEGEVYPNIDNRSNLTIAQRLQGMRLDQLRERSESQKMEKIPQMKWHDEDQCFKIDGVPSVIKRDQMKRSFYKKEENDDVEEPYIYQGLTSSAFSSKQSRERENRHLHRLRKRRDAFRRIL